MKEVGNRSWSMLAHSGYSMKNERKYGGGSCEIGKQKGKRKTGRRECYTRFSRQEQEMLVEGIRKFGVGNWKRILCAYKFHEKRTAVDLKDKYRNILRAEERERSCGIRRDECTKVSCKREAVTRVEIDGFSGQGQGRYSSGGLECDGTVDNKGGWDGDVQVYGWESRTKRGILPFTKGFHVTVSTSHASDANGEMTESDIGERVEVCRPPAAMRLERLLCPAE